MARRFAAGRLIVNRASLLFASMLLVGLGAASTFAQKPADVVGNWSGALQVDGGLLRLALHVSTDTAGKLSVTLDSLDQNAMGLQGSNVVLKGYSFSFEIPSVSGTYTGTLDGDGENIRGTWNQGVPLPLVFTRQNGGPVPTAMPTPTPSPAMPPVALDNLKPILDRELAPVLDHGLLSKASSGGLVIGLMDRGQRLIFAYGIAKPDSIFEIGSITKTFTGLVLAQMVVQKKVSLDTPIRTLLPAGVVAKPKGTEITLVDLATQHSGLPRMPDNFKPQNPLNPYVDYHAAQLQEFIAKHGAAKPADAAFLYSNLGFGLLGYGLSLRAGVPYGQLVSTEITGPLRMSDTGVTLSPEQRSRLIQGYDYNFDPTPPWDLDAFAGAGAIKSTAADILTYLDANLHPDKYATGAAADSRAATLPAAVALDHQVRSNVTVSGDTRIALAWFFNPKTGSYFHSGGTGGYRSLAGFNPAQDRAIVVLYNRDDTDPGAPQLVERVVENIDELMTGKPSIPLDFISEEERLALVPLTFTDRSIQGPYHCTLTPFSLPPTIKDSFKPTGTGDIHIVADGNGKYSEGTWIDHIRAPGLDLTCKLKMVSGNYSVTPNGTGTEHSYWKLVTEESPRRCFAFFSPARPPVTTDSEVMMTDSSGKTVYSTSINRFAVLSSVCQRETAH